jgi:hypothetical protein
VRFGVSNWPSTKRIDFTKRCWRLAGIRFLKPGPISSCGVGLIGVLPPRVTQKLSDKGFNLEALSGLQGDKLNQVLNELCVDIDSDDGKHVHIFCE